MSKVEILIVEDESTRVEQFKDCFDRTFDNWALDHAETPGQAIKLLEGRTNYNLILLDHDLADDETSIGVAKKIVENSEKYRKHLTHPIFIHSVNPVGATNLQDILASGDLLSMRAPFLWSESKFNQLVNFYDTDEN